MRNHPVQLAQLKVALVHDFLREYGGAERVLEALHEIFPTAPVYVAFVDRQALGIHWQRFADWKIEETNFAHIPLHTKLYSPLRFLAPRCFAQLDLTAFDLVISSSNAFEAKAVRASKGKHLCYCHTPPRALYGYSTMSAWKKNPIINMGGQLINHYMRLVDFQVAQQVDVFIANSKETQQRIKKFYRRDSVVIYPPVTVEHKLPLSKSSRDYYFYISRLGLQKHPEIAVAACTQLNLPLKVAGSGQMLAQLQAMAGPTIEFLGPVADEQLAQLYAGAKALLYPVEDEDFGIVPVEAMAAGVPVIAHRSGGPKETIIDGQTGILFDDLSTLGLKAAIKKFQHSQFDVQQINRHAQQFSQARFQKEIVALINNVLAV